MRKKKSPGGKLPTFVVILIKSVGGTLKIDADDYEWSRGGGAISVRDDFVESYRSV